MARRRRSLRLENLEIRTVFSATVFESGEIGYFLDSNEPSIERFDIQNETWLSSITLEGVTGGPTIGTANADGLYVAFDRAVYRFDLDGSNPVHLLNTQYSVGNLLADGNLLIVNYGGSSFTSVDLTTSTVIDTESARYNFTLGSASIAPSVNRIIGRSSGVSPADIVYIAYDDNGTFTTNGDSPYHGDYPNAARTWVYPDDARVVDSAGIIYSTGGLAQVNSLATSIVDLDFYGADIPIVLQGDKLTAYSQASLPTGEYQLSTTPTNIFVSDEYVIAFKPDGLSPHGYAVEQVPIGDLSPATPGDPVNPIGLAYDPDKIEVTTTGDLLLFSKANQSVFVWDIETQAYSESIPLIGIPKFMAYSGANNTIYLAYDSGLIRQISLDDPQRAETNFANLPQGPLGLSTAGQYVFAVDPSGAWVSHYTFAPDGTRVSAVEWNYRSTEYVWSEANQKMYFFRDDTSPNDLLWENIDADNSGAIGTKQDSPLHNSAGFNHPIRVAPDGSIVVLGSGMIHDALTLERQTQSLANSITDAAWLDGKLFTTTSLNGQTLYQYWSLPTYSPSDELVLPGTPKALLTATTEYMVGVSLLDGVPRFTALDVNLDPHYANQPPTITLDNATLSLREDTSTATRIKVADISIVDDDGGNNVLSLAGADVASFEIDGTELFLRAGTALDASNKSQFNILVQVDDDQVGFTPDFTVPFTLTITELNLPPTGITLTDGVISLPEDFVVANAYPLAQIDVLDDGRGSNTLSLSGADASSFEIVGNVLQLKAGTILDYDTQPEFRVTIEADDPEVGSTPDVSTEYVLTILYVNQAPQLSLLNVITSVLDSVDTSSALPLADIQIIDDDHGSNDLFLSGTDADAFEIVNNQLRLRANTLLNATTQSTYTVFVNVDDAAQSTRPSDTVEFTLTITPGNVAPRLRLSNVIDHLPENSSSPSGITLAVIDILDDGLGTNVLGLTGTDADAFEIVNGELHLKAGISLDATVQSTYAVTVWVDDDSTVDNPDDAVDFTLTIDRVNHPPTVELQNVVTNILEIGTLQEALKVADIVVHDDDLGSNTLVLTGPQAAAFEIVGSELYLKQSSWVSFNKTPSLSVSVAVDDPTLGSGVDAQVDYTLTVDDDPQFPHYQVVQNDNGTPDDSSDDFLEVKDVLGTGGKLRLRRLNNQLLIEELSGTEHNAIEALATVAYSSTTQVRLDVSAVEATGQPLRFTLGDGDDEFVLATHRYSDPIPATGLSIELGGGDDSFQLEANASNNQWIIGDEQSVVRVGTSGRVVLAGVNRYHGGFGTDTFYLRGITNPDFTLLDGWRGADDAIVVKANADVELNNIQLLVQPLATPGQGRTLALANIRTAFITGGEGDNLIDARQFTGPTKLLGGEGDDILWGGINDDVIDGGSGNDWISGGRGNDVLIGSRGRDILIGGFGSDRLNLKSVRTSAIDDDILIGGRTNLEYDTRAIDLFMQVWASDQSFSQRVKAMRDDGVGPSRTLLNDSSVLDDGAVDTLYGGHGVDWFFVHREKGATRDRSDANRREDRAAVSI